MKFYFIVIFTILYTNVKAQSVEYIWAKDAQGRSNDKINSLSTDNYGNSYISGDISSDTLTFGSINLIKDGYYGVFFAKYDALGNVEWAKRIEGSRESISKCDSAGNLYIGLKLHNGDTLVIDTNEIVVNGFQSYLLKIDKNGNFLWVRQASSGFVSFLSIDPNENVYVAGGDATIDKFDKSGNLIWSKLNNLNTGIAGAKGLLTNRYGNTFLLIYTQSLTLLIDSLSFSNPDNIGYWVIKYDSLGNLLMAKPLIDGFYENIYLTNDLDDNIYVAGSFYWPNLIIGSFNLVNANPFIGGGAGPNSLNYDIFLAKFDSLGTVLWAKRAGGVGAEGVGGLEVDSQGNIFITGVYSSTTLSFDNFSLTADNYGRQFLAKFNFAGEVIFALFLDNAASFTAYLLDLNNLDELYFSGYYVSTSISFGPWLLNNLNSLQYNSNIFITKINASVGIENNSNEKFITIFPNPFSSEATIDFDDNLIKVSAWIFNVQGDLVREIGEIIGNSFIINKEDLSNGVYFMKLITNRNELTYQKFVICD